METRLEEQKVWIRAVAKELGLTVSALARKSGLAPSTLNKPLNDPYFEGELKQKTLEQIAEFSGIAVLQFPGRPKGFAENEAAPYVPGNSGPGSGACIEALCTGRNGRQPWVSRAWSLDLEGILPGDVLITDQNRMARPGDIVCAQIYDHGAGRAETAFRKYDPPYLIAHSTRGTFKPLLVDDDTVRITGVVDGVLRFPTAA
jgi:lambda repressor-like predicted transcriptional regulator